MRSYVIVYINLQIEHHKRILGEREKERERSTTVPVQRRGGGFPVLAGQPAEHCAPELASVSASQPAAAASDSAALQPVTMGKSSSLSQW